jgi:hypothetical protein
MAPQKHASAPARLETVRSPSPPKSPLYAGIPKTPAAKRVVFCFGRFQPPTIGHRFVFETVKKLAQGTATMPPADYFIIPSANCDAGTASRATTSRATEEEPTQTPVNIPINTPINPNGRPRRAAAAAAAAALAPPSASRPKTSARSACAEIKNPLTLNQRIHFLKKMYPEDQHRILDIRVIADIYHQHYEKTTKTGKPKATPRSFNTAIHAFAQMGYTEIFQVFGGKEYKDFKTTYKPGVQRDLNKDFGENVITYDLMVLEREDGAPTSLSQQTTVATVSGTLMRQAVKECHPDKFAEGVPEPSATFTPEDRLKLFYALRRGYGKSFEKDSKECPPEGFGFSPKKGIQLLKSVYEEEWSGGAAPAQRSKRSKRSTMARKDSTKRPAK